MGVLHGARGMKGRLRQQAVIIGHWSVLVATVHNMHTPSPTRPHKNVQVTTINTNDQVHPL